MEALCSYLEEEHNCNLNHEEEDGERQDEEGDAPVKEETHVQKEQCKSWAPSFFFKVDREVHHFVGQEIVIQEAQDSFAATTWPAAPALCQYLERHYKDLNLVDKAVLEIGSGTGLVAIVAALLGAWVTATDLPDALSNLRVNLSKNTRGKSRHTPQVAALPWGFDLEHTYPTSVYHYDYVLAADVVYHHDFPDELLATMKHFCQPGTTLLWANKIRMVTDVEFAGNFKKTFDTKMIFEDGDMKIFMATCREEGEEEDAEVEEVLMDGQVESTSENERGNNMEKAESVEVKSEDGVSLTDNRDGDDDEDNGDEDVKAEAPKDDQVKSTCELDLRNNIENVEGKVGRREEEEEEEEEVVLSDSSEKTDDEEEEKEGNGDEDTQQEPTDSAEDTPGEQKNATSFFWTPNIICGITKDIYQYLGMDIIIHESIGSFGAVMWPAALALCTLLENNRDTVNLQDKTVLELGAGTGLVAIVASLLGAKVTATDLPDILGNLRANVMRNIRGRSRHLPQIWPLSWSFDVGRIYPSHLHRFDYVLATDVVYHHDYLDELLSTMVHFCHPRTTIIWANKVRMESDKMFMEKFKKEFDTTLLAEDGDMKIFMGKFRM